MIAPGLDAIASDEFATWCLGLIQEFPAGLADLQCDETVLAIV
jgi:hypothetical protein